MGIFPLVSTRTRTRTVSSFRKKFAKQPPDNNQQDGTRTIHQCFPTCVPPNGTNSIIEARDTIQCFDKTSGSSMTLRPPLEEAMGKMLTMAKNLSH